MRWLGYLVLVVLAGCAAETVSLTGQTKEFELTATSFSFEPALITVSAGDHVKLLVTAADKDHGISLPAFGVNEQTPQGVVTIIEFDATRRGLFEYRCNTFCGSGHDAMIGAIEVH
ncbi:cupredoxin domain-containing protein [Candidatus Woesearchaeota archaeon]|nr:cupredoxin domain-containing protein [Candidatus Woesearchaeota archaeon]